MGVITRRETKNLEKFFDPRSIALIGVSRREGSIGYSLFDNLLKGGFGGRIYGVSPKIDQLFGQKIYRSIDEIEGNVDLAIIAVSIEKVPSIIRDCDESRIKCAIVVSTGGDGLEGSYREEIVREVVRADIRIIGPDCHSFVIPHLGINASFSSSVPPKGSIAFISQSGALCTGIIDWACKGNVGFSHVISVGDMVDVGFGTIIDYLGDDPKVKSILLYIESITNIKEFVGAARSVSRVKPIIALKAGKSREMKESGLFQTSALMTEEEIFSTIFKRTGIVKVDTVHELFNTADPLSKQPRPIKPNLAIITNSDGTGLIARDILSNRWNICLAKLKQQTVEKLGDILPPTTSKENPICMLGDSVPEYYSKALRVSLDDDEVGGVIIIFTPSSMVSATDLAEEILEASQTIHTKPIFVVLIGGVSVEEATDILNEAGIPTFGTPEEAVNAFMHTFYYSFNLKLIQETPKLVEGNFEKKRAQSVINSFLEDKESEILTELDSKAIISSYEIPVNPTEVATTAAEASQVAKELGFPVVLKIHSPDILEKSGLGGVDLDLHSQSEVRDSFERITSNVKRQRPEAAILGVTVEPMILEKGFEIILGAKKDPVFGPIILFGAGGEMTEFVGDVATAIPPLNSTLALRLMEKTKIFSLLSDGFHDIPPADIDGMIRLIVNFSELVVDFPEIAEIDINPIYVRGEHVLSLDSRIKIERTVEKSPRHLLIAPYPSHYESYHTLKDGTVVMIRPIKPEDEPLMFDLFDSFSEKTIVYRFFHLINVTTHEKLVRFTQIDYDREIVIIAVSQPPGREKILGVFQLVFERREDKAEFAVVVGDLWQGRGLGNKLMEIGISIAEERGVRILWGEIIPENVPMINLSKKMGFTIRDREGSIYAELDLNEMDKE